MHKFLTFTLSIYPLLKNLVIILSVWAIKEAVTRLAFECYCLRDDSDDWWTQNEARKLYSMLFLVIPAALFWIGGIFLKESTWRCVTGWRVQEKFRFPARSCACFFWTIGSTGLAPLTWIFLIFLDGRYYECAFTDKPTHCFTNEDKDGENFPRRAMDNEKLKFISQIIAYLLTGFCLLFYSLSMLLCRCCSNMTYYQWRHSHQVQDLEEEAFQDAAKEYYKDDMKKRWKTMFAMGVDSDWDVASELPPISPEQRGKNTHYTALQAWRSVHAPPDVTLRGTKESLFTHGQLPVDPNMVVVTIKSGEYHSVIDVQRSTEGDHSQGGHHKSHAHKHRSRSPSPARKRYEHSSEYTNRAYLSSSLHENGSVLNGPPSIQESFDKSPLVSNDDISMTSSMQVNHLEQKKRRRKGARNKVVSSEQK